MKFMLMVKASESSEAGIPPTRELISDMMKFNEEMAKAGILVGLNGLHPSSKGARISFSNGKPVRVDGPFAETKELVGGYWIIEVSSKEEAVAWAMCAPAPHGPDQDGQIEVRQIFDLADFPAEDVSPEAVERVTKALAAR